MTIPPTDAELRGLILSTLYRWRDWSKSHPDREITRALGCSGRKQGGSSASAVSLRLSAWSREPPCSRAASDRSTSAV